MPGPTSSLYDLRLQEANGNLARIQATPENTEIVSITPIIGQNFNAVVRVKIDCYPDIDEGEPLPEGAKSKYIYRSQKLMRAHISKALLALIGKPDTTFSFHHNALSDEVTTESLSNYFDEIGLGLTEGEFTFTQIKDNKWRLDVHNSVNFYGHIYFTDLELDMGSVEDDVEEEDNDSEALTDPVLDTFWLQYAGGVLENASLKTDVDGNIEDLEISKIWMAPDYVVQSFAVDYSFVSDEVEFTTNSTVQADLLNVLGLAPGATVNVTANMTVDGQTRSFPFSITNEHVG